ncbi:MAG: GatB/YqeY domain-containing protein [Patescibacteria group bacterium]|jgi:hypothetical protein
MDLIKSLETDLIAALKKHESEKVEVLRYVKSLLHNAKIAKREDLTEAEIEKQVASEVKRRLEAIEQFKTGKREDLAIKDAKAIEILKAYLPEAMPGAEIEKLIQEQIAAVGASSIADFGKVMGPVMAKVGTRADGKIVQAKVKELLSKK